MKNRSVINIPHNSADLLPTSGNRARNTLSQLAANHVSSPSAQLQHRLWSSVAVTIVTIAATRSFCQQSVPVPATSTHYPLIPRCDPEVSTSARHKYWWPRRDPLTTKDHTQANPFPTKAEPLTASQDTLLLPASQKRQLQPA